MTTNVSEPGSSRVIVVGAGIAGLTAAYRLQEAGHRVTVLERCDHTGGRMRTVQQDGYRMDIGAGWLVDKYDEMKALAHDLGVGDQLRPTSDLLGFVHGGRVHRMHSKSLLGAARLPVASPRAKLSGLKLLRDARRADPLMSSSGLAGAADLDVESVADYVARRGLHPEFVARIIDPTIRGTLQNTMEQASVADLFFAIRRFWGGGFMNSDTGIDFLSRAMTARLPVELGATVERVREFDDRVEVVWSSPSAGSRTETADGCIIALGGHQAAAICPELDAERAGFLSSLDYPPLISVHIALRRPPPEPAMYIQVPRDQDPGLISIGLEHNKAGGRVPTGHGLVSSFWTGEWSAAHWNDEDHTVLAAVLRSVEPILGPVGTDVEFTRVSRWSPGVVVSRVGTWRGLARFTELTPPDSRLRFAGDYFGPPTTNIPLCSALDAAAALAGALRMTNRRQVA